MRRNRFLYMVLALTMAMALWGCSGEKAPAEETEKETEEVSDAGEDLDDASEAGSDLDDEVDAGEEYDPEERGETAVFIRTVEGESEEVPATLYKGEGYSVLIPDEGWVQEEPNVWSVEVNEEVKFWVSQYVDTSLEEAVKLMENAGYAGEGFELEKQDGDITCTVMLQETADGNTWGVFTSCPMEAIEGWNTMLMLIADSFIIS